MLAAAQVKAAGHDVMFKEYAELDMPVYNDEICSTQGISSTVNPLAEALRNVQGIIISAPEYNWSYPGSLKNIIDWTSRIKPQPLAGKSVLLMCASTSDRGGIVAMTHLKTPFEALQAFVYPRVYTLSNAHTKLATNTFQEEKLQQPFNALVAGYIDFTNKLTKE